MRLHPGIGFLLYHTPALAHDHTCHTAAVLQLAVGRVDDRVDRFKGDIPMYE
jgi:hypothetical protein